MFLISNNIFPIFFIPPISFSDLNVRNLSQCVVLFFLGENDFFPRRGPCMNVFNGVFWGANDPLRSQHKAQCFQSVLLFCWKIFEVFIGLFCHSLCWVRIFLRVTNVCNHVHILTSYCVNVHQFTQYGRRRFSGSCNVVQNGV